MSDQISPDRVTRAAVLVKQNEPLQFWDLEIPPLKAGQVLVKIAHSCVCHTQLNEIQGIKGPDPYLPHTLGHEASGTILEIGENVKKVNVGDRVVCTWMKGAGPDVPSTKYKRLNTGELVNSGAVSTFMDKAVISENRVVPIEELDMPLKEMALFGCALPTGLGVVFRQMDVRIGNSLAIFGVGGVGQSALIGGIVRRAKPLIAIDVDDEKLEKARQEFGATHTINALKEDPVAKIMEITNNKGADFAMESCGQVKVMQQAFKSVRNFGGLCVITGNPPKGINIEIDPYDLICGKKILGSWGGDSKIEHDIDIYVLLYTRNEMGDIGRLITHETTLDNIQYIFDELAKGKVGRGMINFDN